jgi:uncharacterized membrane protein
VTFKSCLAVTALPVAILVLMVSPGSASSGSTEFVAYLISWFVLSAILFCIMDYGPGEVS